MPNLDAATIKAVLDKQGMPNTTENLNRIAQFAAINPDMLERYLGRGTDASMAGSATDSINRSIDNVERAQLAGPNPYRVDVDPNTGMTNVGPGLVRDQPQAGGRGGGGGARRPLANSMALGNAVGPRGTQPQPQPQPQAQATPLPSDPITMGNTGYTFGGDNRVPNQANPPGALDWILPSLVAIPILRELIGGTSGTPPASAAPRSGVPATTAPPEAQYVGPMKPQEPYPYPGTGRITAQRSLPGGADNPLPQQGGGGVPAKRDLGGRLQDPADVARMKAEVEAERAAALKAQIGNRNVRPNIPGRR